VTALNLDSTSKERQFVSYLDKLVSETTKANRYSKVWKSIRGYIEEYHTELNQAAALPSWLSRRGVPEPSFGIARPLFQIAPVLVWWARVC